MFTIVSPRGQLEKVETRMSKASWAMAKRAEGAHTNGIETLPVFYGAVVSPGCQRTIKKQISRM